MSNPREGWTHPDESEQHQPRHRRITAAGLLFGSLVLAVIGGSLVRRAGAGGGRDGRKMVSAALGLQWKVQVTELEQWQPPERFDVVSFRAGYGLVAMLTRAPIGAWEFMVREPALPAGGFLNPWWGDSSTRIGFPSDIVGVAPGGVAWYLDSLGGRVVAQDVGLVRHLVATLGVRGTADRGCLLPSGRIAFSDRTRPAQVFVHPADVGSSSTSFRVPPSGAHALRHLWKTVRFGGSGGGPCVLWSPAVPLALVLTDSSVSRGIPLRSPGRKARWYTWVWRRVRGLPDPPLFLDVTSVHGALAVLEGGPAAVAGTLVDLYTLGGRYVETIRFSTPCVRIAGDGDRLFVLQRGRQLSLASYAIPLLSDGRPIRDFAEGVSARASDTH